MLWTNYDEVLDLDFSSSSTHARDTAAGADVCGPHLRPNGHYWRQAHKVRARAAAFH